MENLVCCVIPNWNGIDSIGDALASLEAQTQKSTIIVVENGSTDGSIEFIEKNYPDVVLLKQPKNLGFAEGVNVGIRYANNEGADAVALFNNDAIANKDWLKHLVDRLDSNSKIGIVTCKFMKTSNEYLDSTGDQYTSWGLPYPRGRRESNTNKYDDDNYVFGASGGASLYRTKMLKEIGLFDKDFFAYYEDIDVSFRAQLVGWKVYFEPKAVAYHAIGGTSRKLKGFTTYQTIKNLPWIFWKDVPLRLMPTVFPRLSLAMWGFIVSAIGRGHTWYAAKGIFVGIILTPKKLVQRRKIQKNKKVTDKYIRSIITWDLPPNARRLRNLRSRLRGSK
jgi:GT2 family glycosyltransferase